MLVGVGVLMMVDNVARSVVGIIITMGEGGDHDTSDSGEACSIHSDIGNDCSAGGVSDGDGTYNGANYGIGSCYDSGDNGM